MLRKFRWKWQLLKFYLTASFLYMLVSHFSSFSLVLKTCLSVVFYWILWLLFILVSLLYHLCNLFNWIYPMDTSSLIRHQFDVETPRGNLVEITSTLKGNPRRNYDNDSRWIFRRGFDFQNRRNIDEFSTWIFLCPFNVKSTWLLYSLFPFYHFLLWEPILNYSGIILSRSNFKDIGVLELFELYHLEILQQCK